MSGGVDSSVSALLLKSQGYQVEGLFMKNWNEDDGTEYCTAMADLMDAAAVCDTLGIPLHTANFASDYWDNVFEHFLDEFKRGRTPNPDILCNREIKFKIFMDKASELGADCIATGHYARLNYTDGSAQLLKGLDANKDQSYFLHAVAGDAFARTLFPIGAIEKSLTRTLAHEHGLVTHSKKDSTGICFIGERRFKDFLQTYLPAQNGDIVTEDGKKIGSHEGLMFYTMGQRQGLGIGGVKDSANAPWFVAGKDLESNELIVVQGKNHPMLFKPSLIASQLHWINDVPESSSFTCTAKTRYRQEDQACTVTFKNDRVSVDFEAPQRAITPGQSVVFYQNDLCLGGGVIEH